MIGIQNPSSTKTGIQYLESSTWNLESTSKHPGSKTVFDYLKMRCTGVKKGKKGGIRPCAENTIFSLFPLPPSKLRQNSQVKAVIQTLSLDTSPLKKRNTAELGYSW